MNLSVWNAQSVGNKTEVICTYVIEHDIDILCLTETWMHQDDPVVINEMSPPGYAFINVPRDSDDHHGGIGVLYKSQLNLCHITNLDFPVVQTFEYAVLSNMSRSMYIVIVYRPPPSVTNKLKVSTFLDEFEHFMDCVNVLPGKVLLTGDLNVHYDLPEKYDVKRYSTCLASVGMTQHVHQPTHRCGHILDHVISRQNESLIHSLEVDNVQFTKDHYMINCSLYLPKPDTTRVTRTVRKFRQIDHQKFAADLTTEMSAISQEEYTDVNELLGDFNSSCMKVLDSHAPSSTKSSRIKHRPGWFDDSINDAIRERRRCERKWRKSKDIAHLEEFKTSKQTVKDLVTDSKTLYYKARLSDASCVKDMYKVVGELLNKDSSSLPDTDNPSALANKFGDFFIGKVDKIRNEVDKCSLGSVSSVDLGSCSISSVHNISHDSCISFRQFECVSENDLLEVITKCPNKTCPLDVLPTWLVKQHIQLLLPNLTRIVNMSLSSGIFPQDLRRAVITPVLKKPSLNKNDLKNYRPIANLQFTSKIIEKCAVSQYNNHIDRYNLSEPMQSAYKTCHSTETALACVHNDFCRALDDQKAVILVMLDLSAAFDTVDSDILLQRVEDEFGIAGTGQEWLSSYLDNRSCKISVAGAFSSDFTLKYGLPQGSVVGPLGFVLYTHVVGRIIRHHKLDYHLYADDIQLYITIDPNKPGDVACAIFKLTQCIKDINCWMVKNKLKLNPDKTEFFVMSSVHHQQKLQDLSLHIDDVTITASSSIRNLGIVFDPQLTMSQHVTNLCKSNNWQIRNITRIRRFLDQETCANLVRSLILSRLDYCNILFNGMAQKDLYRLQKLQNKCARLVYLVPKSVHVSPLLKELHWLRIEERIKYKTLLYVFKSLNGLCPQYISDCLVVKRPRLGSVTTRSCHGLDLLIPRTTRRTGDMAYSVAAPQLWNKLPITIRRSSSADSFKSYVKTYLFV
jgi:exonuclease III